MFKKVERYDETIDGVRWLGCVECGKVMTEDHFRLQKKWRAGSCIECENERKRKQALMQSAKKRGLTYDEALSYYVRHKEKLKEQEELMKYKDAAKLYTADNTANICFDCQRALGGCSWSAVDETKVGKPIKFEPVEGWDAELVYRFTQTHGVMQTYAIKACPLFIPDEKRISYTYDDEEDE